MKKIIKLQLLSIATILAINTQAQEVTPLEINGFGRVYSGVLLDDNHDFSINQNTLDLTLKHQKGNIGFVANPYFNQYASKDNQFNIRELYIDIFTDKVDIRIGKQQIIWGQADGVFITDIVSPKNLTEFLLWDFNEIRMGVTAIKTKIYPSDNYDFELVYIPTFSSTIAPEQESIWMPKTNFPINPTFDYSKATINQSLENGEFFAKFTQSSSLYDLQLMGAYTWDDDPSMHISKTIDPASMQLTNLKVSPEYHRLTVAGASFSTEIMSFILRGEGAYYQGKLFQTAEPTAIDGLTEKDYINYVVGIDKTIGDWKLSSQFIQKNILDYEQYLAAEETENLLTFMANKTMFREQVRVELFGYLGLNNEDSFIRLRSFYLPYDGLTIELGYNLFSGNEGTFGQYDDNDMIYTKIKYNF